VSLLPCGHQTIQACYFTSPQVHSTCYSVPGDFPPHKAWRPRTPHCPWQPSLPHQRVRMPDSPLKSGKLQPVTLKAAPEALFPQHTQKPSASHCTSLQKGHVSHVYKLESQLLCLVAISYSAGARRLASYSAQRPSTSHCDCRRVPCPHQRVGTSAPLLSGEKR
jgi:hypothetical protein